MRAEVAARPGYRQQGSGDLRALAGDDDRAMARLCQGTIEFAQHLFGAPDRVRADGGERISHVQDCQCHGLPLSPNSQSA